MPDFKNNPDAGLIVLMAASACVYLYWLKLDAINGLRPVAVFLCAMLVLFLLYGMAARVVRQARHGTWKWVAAGAVLFRLILLPAGLPAEASAASKLGMLRRDAAGQEVTFERFQLFDDDIWRYLWDGHVAAAGVNPYATAPASAALDALAADPPWSDIRDNVSYPAVATIYPPLAQ